MSARECPCQFNGRWQRENGPDPRCDACLGTGKVHPSVEGEIVREEWARPYPDDQWSINVAGVGWLRVSGPGQWRIIVQKVGE